jgi:O-antigen ligase
MAGLIRNSFIYGLWAAVIGAWRGSFLRRVLFDEFGVEGAFERGFLGAALNGLGALAEKSSGFFMGVIRKSLIYRAASKFAVFSARISAGSAAGAAFSKLSRAGLLPLAMAALIFITPLVPTKYVHLFGVCAAALFFVGVFITGGIRLKFAAADALALMFALCVAVSVIISYNRAASLPVAAVYIFYIILYFAARHAFNTPARARLAWWAAVVSGALVAAYGIFQKVTGSFTSARAWIDEEMFGEGAARVYSTLDNPNVLGEYLLFIIPLALAGLYFVRPLRAKIIPLCALGAAALCIVYTQSRGAWLGLILGMAVFALINDRRLAALGVLMVLAAPMIAPASVIERFMSIGNMTDGSTSYRVNIWLASLLMIKEFWPSGIGLGTPTFVFIYRLFAFNAVYAPHSHNLFLQIIIDLGAAGIVSFAVFTAVSLKGALAAAARGGGFKKAVPAALAAGAAGFLLQGLTDNVWYNYRVVAFFWMMMGLCAGNWKAAFPVPDGADKKEERAGVKN